ncbi:MAG: hypothetical protein KGZ71_09600 [Desulfobulbaceae bacterium]|nr:hypothetical protein [Desulfobulbaceae bacterium]
MLEKTTDGGNTWTLIFADTTFKSSDSIYLPNYWGVACEYFEDGKIIIFTNRGHIIISEDFGESFINYPQIENYGHHSFVMLDSINAITTSVNWVDYPGSKIQFLKSSDACKSWKEIIVPDSIKAKWYFGGLYKQKDKSLMIYCETIYGLERDSTKNYFYHTDFEGSFWKFFEVPKFVDNIYMFDEYEGFATGRNQIFGSFNDTAITSKTYDGGKTWIVKSKTTWPNEMFSSQLIHNDTNVFISGSEFGFLKSTDKGESWYQPEFQLNDDVNPLAAITSLECSFDNGILYFYTLPMQVLKATRIGTSVASPSVKPKRIYPNPVTYGSDFIAEYEIATSGHLKMYLSDLSGREVCPLYSDFAESGSYSISLRLPENISSGSYWLVSEQHGYKHVQLLNVVK